MVKAYIESTGFDSILKRMKKLEMDSKKAAEKALIETHKEVTNRVDESLADQYMPAHGKYSVGEMKNMLKRKADVKWVGTCAEVSVGFDLKEYLVPLYVIYGTPMMSKNVQLYNALFSSKTKKKVTELQKEVFQKMIRDAGG